MTSTDNQQEPNIFLGLTTRIANTCRMGEKAAQNVRRNVA